MKTLKSERLTARDEMSSFRELIERLVGERCFFVVYSSSED